MVTANRARAIGCLSMLCATMAQADGTAKTPPFPGGRFASKLHEVRVTLAQRGYELTPDDMERALHDANRPVQWNALWGLAATGSVSKVATMKGLLIDPDLMTRFNAIYALDDLRKRFPEVAGILPQTELCAAARKYYADALSGDGIFPPRVYALGAAKLLLEVAGDSAGYPIVMQALTGGDIAYRGSASSVAQLFAMHGVCDASGKEIDWITPLAALARDKRAPETTRIGAVSALIAIGSPKARAALSDLALTADNPKVRSVISAYLSRSPAVHGPQLGGPVPEG